MCPFLWIKWNCTYPSVKILKSTCKIYVNSAQLIMFYIILLKLNKVGYTCLQKKIYQGSLCL